MLFSIYKKAKYISSLLVIALILVNAPVVEAAQKGSLLDYKKVPSPVLSAAVALSEGNGSVFSKFYNLTIDRTANIFAPFFTSSVPEPVVTKIATTTVKVTNNIKPVNNSGNTKTTATTTAVTNKVQKQIVRVENTINQTDDTSSLLDLFRLLSARILALEKKASSSSVQNIYNTYTTQNVTGGS